MDARRTHNMPHFRRSDEAVYSQIVYAGKSTDVAHVLCHGRWLMRERELLTLDEEALIASAQAQAQRVDEYLRAHTGDVLSKLLTVTQGMERGESFEVQAKLVLRDDSALERLLTHGDVTVLKQVHYRQYDTWFTFADEADGRLRYREDDLLDEQGGVSSTRSRLTLTRPNKIDDYDQAVTLSHSRFIAPADRPLRFYREYFRPDAESALEKDRRRWHILYQGRALLRQCGSHPWSGRRGHLPGVEEPHLVRRGRWQQGHAHSGDAGHPGRRRAGHGGRGLSGVLRQLSNFSAARPARQEAQE